MIRPRAGDFFYSPSEFEQMKGSIADAQEARMDGIVLGVLTSERCVDIARTRQLVEAARPLPVTFHRAFDEVAVRRQALEEVIETGVQRILTSGGGKSALEGAAILAELVAAAGNRIIILPGAGITAANFSEVQKRTRATEFHSGLSAVLPYGTTEYAQFEEEVGKLAEQIARISQS